MRPQGLCEGKRPRGFFGHFVLADRLSNASQRGLKWFWRGLEVFRTFCRYFAARYSSGTASRVYTNLPATLPLPFSALPSLPSARPRPYPPTDTPPCLSTSSWLCATLLPPLAATPNEWADFPTATAAGVTSLPRVSLFCRFTATKLRRISLIQDAALGSLSHGTPLTAGIPWQPSSTQKPAVERTLRGQHLLRR